MPDRNDTAPRERRGAKHLRLLVLGSVVGLGGAMAVLYGMGLVGKEGPAACPGAQATAVKLGPLVHGEVAAFGLSNPARVAPELSFNGPDGRPVTLASFQGRTVLVNLWATWCVPCRKEMPSLDQLQGKLGGPDFQVVAINVDTARPDRPKAFLQDTGVKNLTFYADPTANVLQELKSAGQLLGLPTTLLVDRRGCELGTMAGPAEWASPEAEQLIAAAKSS